MKSPALLAFCRSISLEQPIYVRSRPAPNTEPSHCFDNVDRTIARRGGDMVYGWAIWHFRGAYFEAEHHGIWRKPKGELLDVSPQLNRARKILFLPDPVAIYDPLRPRTNRIEVEGNDSRARELVEAVLARNAILDSYRQGGARAACLSFADQLKGNALLSRIQSLLLELA